MLQLIDSSWEHASSLPHSLVKEFEDGNEWKIQRESFTSGGETIHMLSAQKNDGELPPKPKRPREDHDISNNSG